MTDLHLRTIESLALAIRSKDNARPENIRRVCIYCVELAKKLVLRKDERRALQVASLLSDIGYLGVPCHILSRSEPLTSKDLEKVKTHPIVGAQILERVRFPYPVVPIVRSHHEKFDGTGYPDGLKGYEIPIGARILAAVDCLDAAASERHHRAAVPLDEAVRIIASEAVEGFDPQVVETLVECYEELEEISSLGSVKDRIFLPPVEGAVAEPGQHPWEIRSDDPESMPDSVSDVASARREVQLLFELTADVGRSLELEETLSALGGRLKPLIPFDCIAVFLQCEGVLQPAYVSGDDARLITSLDIPKLQGIAEWAAANVQSIPKAAEAEPMQRRHPRSKLNSVLAVPLEGDDGVFGVLALYHRRKGRFTEEHVRVLQTIKGKVGFSVENALRYRQAGRFAMVDYLTGLPNSRALFMKLDAELARSKRFKIPLTIFVCDLEGFKRVNDDFGRAEGDRVLRTVAECLQRSCREYDCVARMGADEFVVVAPGLDVEGVRNKVTQLCEQATRASGKHLLPTSVGAAFYPGDGDSPEELLAQADKRLYRAKQNKTKFCPFDLEKLHAALAPTTVH